MTTDILFTYQPSCIDEPTWTDLQRLHPSFRAFLQENRAASEKYVADLPLRKRWFQTHGFKPSANLCMDGRVSDHGNAVDVPVGIFEMYRSAGSRNTLRNFMYASRTFESVTRSSAIHIDGRAYDLAEMRFMTAHWSMSHPTTASCKAWENQTAKALAAMQDQAHELNFCFTGRMVAFPTLIDTDLDAITMYGPGEPYSVFRLSKELGPDKAPDPGSIVDALRKTFPMDWHPLAALTPAHREAFHPELAERVIANLAFVRNVIASERPLELIEHGERMIFVGRHADWIDTHNSVFLIDDTEERSSVLASFSIAIPIVARNVIADAVAAEDKEWIVPVVINVPYNEPDSDRLVAVQYARYLKADLVQAIRKDQSSIFGLLDGTHSIRPDRMPTWMLHQVTGIADRIRIVMSVSRRKTRLFEPFT